MPFSNSRPYVKWSDRTPRQSRSVNTEPYVKWSERKRLDPDGHARQVEIEQRQATQEAEEQTAARICGSCGGEILKGKFCNRSCHAKSNIRALQAWEQSVGERLEEQGWQIIRPGSCCDRLGIKDGKLYFLEFKPKGKTQLRRYQQLVRDLVPHMFGVVVGSPEIRGGENVEVLSVRAGRQQRPKTRPKKRSKPATSRFVGVCFDKSRNLWRASIQVNGKRVYLGVYESEEEAGRAYEAAFRNACRAEPASTVAKLFLNPVP